MAELYDRRVTPARADLAAEHLRGHIEAARYAEARPMQVRAASIPLRPEPDAAATMDTQLLYGERFDVYDAADGWVWGQAPADGYVGYAPEAAFAPDIQAATHRVSVPATHVYGSESIKTEPVGMLWMTSGVAVAEMGEELARLEDGVYLPAAHLAPAGERARDFVSAAEMFLHVPYLWGGKTRLGVGLLGTRAGCDGARRDDGAAGQRHAGGAGRAACSGSAAEARRSGVLEGTCGDHGHGQDAASRHGAFHALCEGASGPRAQTHRTHARNSADRNPAHPTDPGDLAVRHLATAALIALASTGGAQPATAVDGVTITAQDRANFDRWRDGFRREALAQGIRADVFDAAFSGVEPNGKILKYDRKQPEFSRPIWKYLESAVSETRVANGRKKRALHAGTLARIGQAYGVDTDVVLGIWGMESAYGAAYGDFSIIEALATLAWDGRREKFAKEQLIAALKILQRGDIAPARLKGSWAGAMGHTQFIPTSFQAYAVDFTGDGRRDFWADDPADALASAANYLARHGWRSGEPVYAPVRLPAGIDYDLLHGKNKQPASYWRALGVTLRDGRAVPDHGSAAVIIPAGARGPAFMTFHNFNVIKRYNNADSYALGVAHLGERIAGAGPMALSWPTDDKPLGRTQKKTLQTNLTRLGFDTNGIDGKLGPDSRKAIRAFQRSRGLPADGYASLRLLTRVQQAVEGREPLGSTQVRAIQSRLNARGFNSGTPDGIAGPQTRAAIAAFQRSAGMTADGQPSAAVLTALGG